MILTHGANSLVRDTQGWETALPDDSMDRRPFDVVTYSAGLRGVHTAEGVVSGVYDPTPGAPKEETVGYGAGVAFTSDGAAYDPRFDEAVNVDEATFSAQILNFEVVEVS